MSRGRYWCFTLNNYTTQERSDVDSAVDRSEDLTYLCYGVEAGESGTPHLQGYMEFRQRIRLGAVKRIPGFTRCHLELRKGTPQQAKAYCEKDGEFYEYGALTESKKGKRTDLSMVKEMLDDGAAEADIADAHFGSWVRYHKAFRRYGNIKQSKDVRPDLQVFVLYGEPGTGKTRYVFEHEPSLWINSDPKLQWFDGYAGEEAVCLDDYRGEGSAAFLLRLLDIYPIKVPVKGGFTPWLPKRIYITSNLAPPFGHNYVSEPLKRRIKKTILLRNALDFSDESMMATFRAQLI